MKQWQILLEKMLKFVFCMKDKIVPESDLSGLTQEESPFRPTRSRICPQYVHARSRICPCVPPRTRLIFGSLLSVTWIVFFELNWSLNWKSVTPNSTILLSKCLPWKQKWGSWRELWRRSRRCAGSRQRTSRSWCSWRTGGDSWSGGWCPWSVTPWQTGS